MEKSLDLFWGAGINLIKLSLSVLGENFILEGLRFPCLRGQKKSTACMVAMPRHVSTTPFRLQWLC